MNNELTGHLYQAATNCKVVAVHYGILFLAMQRKEVHSGRILIESKHEHE